MDEIEDDLLERLATLVETLIEKAANACLGRDRQEKRTHERHRMSHR
jgi:hypothetical protein